MADSGKDKEKEEKPDAQPSQSTDDKEDEDSFDFLNPLEILKKLQALSFGEEEEKPEQLLEEVTLDGVVKFIQSDKCQKIVTMAGAGISTSAGIPDFRSPGTGLYDNLQKYDLPSPMAIFELDFFRTKPEPFFHLAKELWPGVFKPTPCHYFLRLLEEKGLLLRHFTQNIDGLEQLAGMSADRVVEAHGTFRTSHCINAQCHKSYPQDWLKEKVMADTLPRCEDCNDIVKPDIVFFGESLPSDFFQRTSTDIPECDLLIIMGTSLVVHPFASLTGRVNAATPRLYINMEKSSGGGFHPLFGGSGFKFDDEHNYRDVFCQTTCDAGCQELADKLGWGDELRSLIKRENARIEKESGSQKPAASQQHHTEEGPSSSSQASSSSSKSSPAAKSSPAKPSTSGASSSPKKSPKKSSEGKL